jgi:hypothetical protein
VRAREPDRSVTALKGTPAASARARLASSVAFPPSGAERTRTTMPPGPPSTAVRPDLGATRTVTVAISV